MLPAEFETFLVHVAKICETRGNTGGVFMEVFQPQDFVAVRERREMGFIRGKKKEADQDA